MSRYFVSHFSSKVVAHLQERLVLVGRIDRIAPGQARGEKRFVPIGFHRGDVLPFERVARIWISRNDLSGADGLPRISGRQARR